jgi:hypothetical protein
MGELEHHGKAGLSGSVTHSACITQANRRMSAFNLVDGPPNRARRRVRNNGPFRASRRHGRT